MRLLLLLLLPFFMGADLPIKYPEKTYSMSKDDFYQWAVNENKQAEIQWIKEFNEGYQYNYGSKIIETLNTQGFNSGTSLISINTGSGVSSSTVKRSKKTVPYRHKNPDFKHPGPLTIINPFVRPNR